MKITTFYNKACTVHPGRAGDMTVQVAVVSVSKGADADRQVGLSFNLNESTVAAFVVMSTEEVRELIRTCQEALEPPAEKEGTEFRVVRLV